MSKYTFDDSYIYYPGTDIPKNKHGIRDKEIVEEIERDLLFRAYKRSHEKLFSDTIFDQKYFIDLHYSAYSDFYDFAGKIRNKNIGKEDTVFCNARYIEQEMARVFGELASENYLRDAADLPREKFARRLAYYSCELIAIHPFFECNGRIIRLFIDLIAVYNGYDYINYPDSPTGADNPYIEASKDCMNADLCKMYHLILSGLVESDDL